MPDKPKFVNFFFEVGSDKQDPEKAVLPAIVFLNAKHPEFPYPGYIGFIIGIGWWHWSVKFGILI